MGQSCALRSGGWGLQEVQTGAQQCRGCAGTSLGRTSPVRRAPRAGSRTAGLGGRPGTWVGKGPSPGPSRCEAALHRHHRLLPPLGSPLPGFKPGPLPYRPQLPPRPAGGCAQGYGGRQGPGSAPRCPRLLSDCARCAEPWPWISRGSCRMTSR